MAGTRTQSCDRYGSGTLHPGHVLVGSLPLLSPAFRRSHFRRQVPVRPLHDSQDKILSVLKQAQYHTGILEAEVQHIIFILLLLLLLLLLFHIYIYACKEF